MKKVLFFDFVHHYGGAQKSTIDMICHLRKAGYEVGVVDPCKNVFFKKALERLYVSYWTCNMEFKLNKSHKVSLIISVFRNLCRYLYICCYFCCICYKFKPNIVWTNSYKSLYIVVFAKLLFRYHFYLFVRGIKKERNISSVQRVFCNLFSSKVLVQTESIRKYLREQKIKTSIEVIPNSISDEVVSYSSNVCIDYRNYLSSFKILFIGTIIKEKGVEELLFALQKMYNKKLNFHAFFVGDFINPEYKEYIDSLIIDSHVERHVSFLGWRQDVRDLISHTDCVVLPSYAEGMPRSVMEAMALGKPVVVTDVGGVLDFVENNVTGIVIPPKDIDAIYEALFFFYSNIEKSKAIGCNARKYIVENFSENKQITILLNYF
ncbi:glycosyltransferase [Phocaeicola sp.]